MTDIVERLTKGTGDWILAHELMQEAAEEIERLREALMVAGTEDAPFTAPNHSFSTMSPKDCYEAGAMDGAIAVREAVKNAARAALEEKK